MGQNWSPQNMPALSVVLPAYNEQSNLADAVDEVLKHVASVVPDLEIIVVNDGSTDQTQTILAALASRHPEVVAVHQANAGHGQALSNGVRKATGGYLLLLDSDRQVSLEDFAAHWRMMADCDVLLGCRWKRADPLHRMIVSNSLRLLLAAKFGLAAKDANAPYKLLGRQVWHEAFDRMRTGSVIPSALLAARALQRTDLRVLQVSVAYRDRPHGPSSLNLRRLASLCAKAVADIFFFRTSSRGHA
ncbi:glycosyltransferase family 2 protein [Mesorhizobium sp. LNHC221B00]|uniref:glycosyltransferase family 2 protein n=1 Tax=Mesorhizobium sp. LNHC221B00 TaxID=1287233 RepID=UPI0012EC0532|nr:glycosyltransferase family 2 protein [Mesorhizobium sp. LNHC221B00]